jgi:hypothetical protein
MDAAADFSGIADSKTMLAGRQADDSVLKGYFLPPFIGDGCRRGGQI